MKVKNKKSEWLKDVTVAVPIPPRQKHFTATAAVCGELVTLTYYLLNRRFYFQSNILILHHMKYTIFIDSKNRTKCKLLYMIIYVFILFKWQ